MVGEGAGTGFDDFFPARGGMFIWKDQGQDEGNQVATFEVTGGNPDPGTGFVGDKGDLAFGDAQVEIHALADALVEVIEELSGFFVATEEFGKVHEDAWSE